MDRGTVQAWADETGNGYRKAAAHFGINVDTAKSWLKAKRVAPKPRVVATIAATSADGTPTNTAPPRARPPVSTKLAHLGEETKAYLRRANRGIARFLATADDEIPEAKEGEDPPPPRDYRQFAEAARALKTLHELAPGIDSFDEQTGTGTGTGGPTEADRARLDAAMLDPLPGSAPRPRLVESL